MKSPPACGPRPRPHPARRRESISDSPPVWPGRRYGLPIPKYGVTPYLAYAFNLAAHTLGRFGFRPAALSLARMTANPKPRIVVIDDDSQHLVYVTTLLTRAHYHSVGFTSARQALAFMEENTVDLVITDIFMPDMDGFELMRAIRSRFPDITVVTLSGDALIEKDFYLKCSTHLGAVATLKKPFEPETLRAMVARLLPRAPD